MDVPLASSDDGHMLIMTAASVLACSNPGSITSCLSTRLHGQVNWLSEPVLNVFLVPGVPRDSWDGLQEGGKLDQEMDESIWQN